MTKFWRLDIFIEFKLFLSGKCIVLRSKNIRGHFELVGQKQQQHSKIEVDVKTEAKSRSDPVIGSLVPCPLKISGS